MESGTPLSASSVPERSASKAFALLEVGFAPECSFCVVDEVNMAAVLEEQQAHLHEKLCRGCMRLRERDNALSSLP
jgi:hypothetical protein